MKGIHKLTTVLLSVVIMLTWNVGFASSSLTFTVNDSDSASDSAALFAISYDTVHKNGTGTYTFTRTDNAIGALGIHGGKVVVTSEDNLNGASSAVVFNDGNTEDGDIPTLEIAGNMNTGALTFTDATEGVVQVDADMTATLNVAPAGDGLMRKTGAGVMEIASDLSASSTLAGINVDAGILYVHGGKAPSAPINVASGAKLQLAGVDDSAESEIAGDLTVLTGGSIEVDADVRVGNALISTCTFDATDGYYKYRTAQIEWPAGHSLAYNGSSGGSTYWTTSDLLDASLTYGGVSLGYMSAIPGDGPSTAQYYAVTADLAAAHPIATCVFNTDDGYYKNGSETLPWPPNLGAYNGSSGGSTYWTTSDILDESLTYGGVSLGYMSAILGDGPSTAQYYAATADLTNAYPELAVSTGMDAAILGAVHMQSGSVIKLGAGAIWAVDISVE